MLLIRCFTFLGVCVEFVAAIAWLAEMFPVPAMCEARPWLYAGVQFLRRAGHRRCGFLLYWSDSLPGLQIPCSCTA